MTESLEMLCDALEEKEKNFLVPIFRYASHNHDERV
jgi:hypothetical protein